MSFAPLKDGIRSTVRIDFYGHVHKHLRGTDAATRYATEVAVLKELHIRGCPYVPRLLEEHPEQLYFVTTNCGRPADQISREKSNTLFAKLERDYGIRHLDAEPRNITYSDTLGTFCLIDFELAEILPLDFHWAALTRSGSRKPANEDSLTIFASGQKGAEILPAHGSLPLTDRDLVFAISDGMGGGNAGAIASATILQQMTQIIPETHQAAATGFFPDSLSHLSQALSGIHSQVNASAHGCAEKSGMAATLALAWFTPDNLYLANVGDSRLYRSRAGLLEPLSQDHTYAWGQWQRGEITEIQYRNHPRRAALYQVVGGGHAEVNPHFAAIPYQPGDRFLICSDGLIDGLWERHLSEALAALTPENTALTAEKLLARALENAGQDDTSLILIAIGVAAS